jgi:hypothetical protein
MSNFSSTPAQAETCLYLSQDLTRMYRPIYLIRFDRRTGEIFMLAGEGIEIIIKANGLWRFV